MISRQRSFDPSKRERPEVLGEWYHETIQIAQIHGFVKGYEDKTFKPLEIIQRQEAMIRLARAARFVGLDVERQALPLLDRNVDLWAREDVALVMGLGLFDGIADGHDQAKGMVSRSQSAEVITNLLIKGQLINGAE